MSKKRILVLGASHSETPILIEANKKSDYVIVAGLDLYKPNLTLCREFITADYSSYTEIAAIIHEHSITHLIPGCNDFALLNAAYLTRELGLTTHALDDPAVSETLHHKDKFRNVVREIGINAPNYFLVEKDNFDPEVSMLNESMLVKPVDLSGGKGISRIDNIAFLEDAIKNALKVSRQKKVLIESFWDGTEHSGQCIIINQKIVQINFSDEYCSTANPFKIQGAFTPSLLTEDTKKEIVKQIEAIAMHLCLVDGFIQMQFINSIVNGPFIVEMSRRLPGDLLGKLYTHLAGDNIYKSFVEFMLCEVPNLPIITAMYDKRIYRHIMEGSDNLSIVKKQNSPEISVLELISLNNSSSNDRRCKVSAKPKKAIIFFKVDANVVLTNHEINNFCTKICP